MNTKNWIDKCFRKKEYKGCGNCKYQPEPMQTCEWLKHEKVVHIICPRWELKGEKHD